MLMLASSDALAQERVTFPSADGKTTLTGYVFMPAKRAAQMPAVVMMHGRGGVYSKAAKGRYDASTISQRHRMWGDLWAANGYVAVLVDSFGPRGYPGGFPRYSYDTRPDAVNEVTVRPLDAYGALTWLRTRKDVAADRIGLQGWSNGGSAALATMAAGAGFAPASLKGFNAALVFYPDCRLRGRFDDGYRPYAPVRVFHGTADEETSFRRCRSLVETQPQGRRRHRDHALSRRGARLRRSRPRAAERTPPMRKRRRTRPRAHSVSSRSGSQRRSC